MAKRKTKKRTMKKTTKRKVTRRKAKANPGHYRKRRKAKKNVAGGEMVQAAGAGAIGAVVSNYAPGLLPGGFGKYAAPAANLAIGLFLNRKKSNMKTAGKAMIAVAIFDLVKTMLPAPAPQMVVSSSAWLPASKVLPPQLQAPSASQLPAETWLSDFAPAS